MVIAWIGYCLLVSALLGLAALATERALGHYRRPVRGVWAAAIAGSLVLPIAAYVAPALVARFSTVAARLPGTVASLPDFASSVPAADASGFAWSALLGPIGLLLGAVWALSVLALGGHLMLTQRRLQREMRGWTPGEILDAPVLMSVDRGPAVVGVRRGVIVMPTWIAELEEDVVRLAFLHEREHQQAGDHRLFAAGLIGVVAMPWNPFAWWQLRRLRLAIEFDCDHRVIARGIAPRAYAEALLAVGRRVSTPPLAAAAFAERRSAVERRLRRMTQPLRHMRGARALVAAGVGTLAVVFACGSPLPSGADDRSADVSALETPAADAPDAVDVTAAPSFIPFDTPPALRNRAEVTKALNEVYPEDIRAAGIGGRIELWLYIDESGTVANDEVKTSSGNLDLDAAAEEVAKRMQFSPAQNEGAATGVWVSQWVTFGDVGATSILPRDVRPPYPGAESVPAADAAAQPLIVVDGVIQPIEFTLADVRKLDIDRVEIVKGAAAQRYGDRAKNGVIQITTKDGAGG